jgi:hypothetical protein
MAVRKWYLDQALASYPSLKGVLSELTQEEVMAALDLESATLRRKSLIDRLIQRAVRLNEIVYSRQLKERFHGKSTKSPVQS